MIALIFAAALTCPDYGQAMSNEFYMAAPSCDFIRCDDPTLASLHAYTKRMRARAARQSDPCIRAAILEYADWLDRDALRGLAEWRRMKAADAAKSKIAP